MIKCSGCKGRIYKDKDRYTKIEDWNCLNKEGESWWHLQCFKKAMNRDLTLLERQAMNMLQKASGIYKNLPEEFKPKEEYVIS